MTRLVCVPLAPQVRRFDDNCELIESGIRRAVSVGADIIVLPELSTSGYMFRDVDEARATAISARSQLLRRWAAIARNAITVVGFCELGEDERLYNSAAVLEGAGVRTVYRKTHLWNREKLVFTAGSQPPPVLSTPHGRLAVLICYDLEFPELTRSVSLHGADLIAAPVNWPLVSRPDGERPPEQIIAMATARTNRIAVACCDRTGTERGQQWTAGTAIVDTSGWEIGDHIDAMLVADLDLHAARNKRIAEYADAFGDRRQTMYRGLS